jgi:hypothetical protein
MTVNVAGRGRRRGSAATAATGPGAKPASRRRGAGAETPETPETPETAGAGVAREAVDAAEPAPLESAAPAAPLGPVARLTSLAARAPVLSAMPAPAASAAPAAPPVPSSVPEVPREAPAVLRPEDRRGYTPPPPPRLSVVPAHHQLAIGELDQTLFDCPSCRRPLALGTRRCPGCGIRLIRGIPLAKAVTFVVVGVLVGTIVGVGGGVIGATLGGGAAGPVNAAGQPSAGSSAGAPVGRGGSPVPTTPATSDPSSDPVVVDPMPAAARAALTQALDMNARLGTADAELRAALAAKAFDASAAAQTMRAISADMVFAEGVASRVSGWTGSAEVGGQLATFYSSVHDTAGAALLNSVRNAGAYRAAARSMVQLLAQRTALDETIRATAAAAGVSLPEPSTTP